MNAAFVEVIVVIIHSLSFKHSWVYFQTYFNIILVQLPYNVLLGTRNSFRTLGIKTTRWEIIQKQQALEGSVLFLIRNARRNGNIHVCVPCLKQENCDLLKNQNKNRRQDKSCM